MEVAPYYRDMRVEKRGFPVNAIETTGAGDTFCGCSLGYLLEHDLKNLTEEELERCLHLQMPVQH